MPRKSYSKKYSKKKPSSRYDTYAKCGAQAASDGAALYTLVKPFLPFNAEYKRVTAQTNANPSTTMVTGLKNAMLQGDDADQRIGRSIRMTSLNVSQIFTKHASATDTLVRCTIVIDTQANAIIIDTADFQSGGYDIQSLPNPDYQGRYKILKNFIVNLTTDRPTAVRKYYVKIPRHLGRVEYNNTNGGTIADINKNALYNLLVSNEPTNLPTVSTNMRMNYIDN